MNCEKCGTEVQAGTKFCPECGNQSFSTQGKGPDEVDLEWLEKIMNSLDYKIDNKNERDNTIFFTHTKMFDMNLSIKKDLISILSIFTMKKAGWGKHADQLSAVNNANGEGLMTKWFFNDERGSLAVFTFIPLLHSLTESDVIMVIKKFNEEIQTGITNSGLLKFSD